MTQYKKNISYIPLMEMFDTVPIETKVDAYLKSEEWPGYPVKPGNPLPLKIKDIDKYIPDVKPISPPGGRVFRRTQRYVFLSNYNNYP